MTIKTLKARVDELTRSNGGRLRVVWQDADESEAAALARWRKAHPNQIVAPDSVMFASWLPAGASARA